MKTIRHLAALAAAALTILPSIAQETALKPTVFSVGVLPFSETDDTKSLGASASELVATQLGMSGHLVLIERSQLDAVLSEQGMGLTGGVDPQSAAKLGNLIGAQILVTGRVFKAGKNTYCIAKAISTATGRSLPAQTQVKGDDWMNAATVLATVISRPTATRVVVDCGKKAFSSDATAPRPLDYPDATSLRLSAEHGQFDLPSPSGSPAVGDRIRIIIGYGDTTVHLHETLVGTRTSHVEVVWPLLGRGKLS